MKFLKLGLILTITVIFSIIVSPFSVYAKESDDTSSLTAVTSASLENENLKLSVSETGSFTIENKKNGTILYSNSQYAENDKHTSGSIKRLMMSELQIEYYEKQTEMMSDITHTLNSSEASITIYDNKDEIIVSYNFSGYSIAFDVAYSLKNDYLSASIITDSIEEMGGYALNSITLLPGLFSATGADNGYIFVPDGSGALINFNNDCSAAYNGAVYGDDVSFDINMKRSYGKEINMPVFGMVSNNVGMMAIIDSCESIAQITAASKNLSNNYNYVYTTAVIKKSYAKSMFSGNDRTKSSARKRLMQISNDENFTVRYYLLGNNADYVTMANKYREYLKSEKGLTKNVSQPVLNVELIGAIDVKANFLGFSYFDIKALTTYKDAKEIISELKEAGVDNLALKYSGWSKSGLTNNKVLKNLKLEKELGNKKAFNELNSFADENSVKIDYDVEMLKFYKGGSKYKVSSPFNETISFSRYLRSVYAKDITKRSWFLLAPEYIEKNFNSVIKSAEKLDIESLSLTTLTNSLYSNSSVKSTLTRTEMISNIINSLDKAEVKFSGESANAYAIPYLSKIYATPTYSSGYRAFDEEIPFYQIVLHGYVDMTNEYQFTSNNRNVNYLRAVESGIQLLYRGIAEKTTEIVDTDYDYLYGTNFDTWKADAVKKYQEYQPLLNKIYDQEIVSHKKLQADVFETTYGNGVSVTVNYNSQPVTVNGAEISGYGFTAKGA